MMDMFSTFYYFRNVNFKDKDRNFLLTDPDY